MIAAIAAHQAEQHKKKESKSSGKRSVSAGGGFHSFTAFDAKTSQAMAHGKAPKRAWSDDSDSEQSIDNDRLKLSPVDWSNPPADLLPRSEVIKGESAAPFVIHFIRFIAGEWRRKLLDGTLSAISAMGSLSDLQRATYESKASLQQTEEMLSPLIQQLGKDTVHADVMLHLDKMVTLAADKEYKQANSSYVELTVGRKKWNNAVFFGEAKHNKGFNARRVKRDEANQFDSDETVQKYVQGLRRILTCSQLIRPNEDLSKHM